MTSLYSVCQKILPLRFSGNISPTSQNLKEDIAKKDDDWVKKCMGHEVEGPRPRGRPTRTWREVAEKDCQTRKLNKEDAIDRCSWWKLIKDV